LKKSELNPNNPIQPSENVSEFYSEKTVKKSPLSSQGMVV